MSQTPAPISHLLPKIIQTLRDHTTMILQAPPGAGKTTCVPLALLEADFLVGKSILMLEPRRLAASNAARFMAKQLGEDVGTRVGFTIRYQRKVSAKTRIEVVTEGILARRLQHDPELAGIGLIIFDEFHERHLQSDLALALCHDVQKGLRDDLRILIMSATLDTSQLAEQLNAPLLASEGHSYPVTTSYLPGRPERSIVDTTIAAIQRALSEQCGDLLVFLPGESEIRRCSQQLTNLDSVMICPLFGNLSYAEQEKAIRPAKKRKIVLATNIAETSLTIDGISVVIDSGYSRQPRFDPGSGLMRLQLGRISQASATQRTGRAGRLAPGHCYRLWSEGTQQSLLPFTPAEIRTADLASLVLNLLAWGVKDPGSLFWLDPPSPAAWQNGMKLLELLGALNEHQMLNECGQKLAELPIHPRLGRLLIAAAEHDLLGLGCDLVALLGEPDPWFKKPVTQQSQSDVLDRLEALWQQGNSGDFAAVNRASRYWRRYFNLPNSSAPPEFSMQQLAMLLTAAYPDRIGKSRQAGSKRYLLSSGQGAHLGNRSAVQNSELLIAVNLHGQVSGEAEISQANSIDRATLNLLYPQLPWKQECYWDQSDGRIIACEQQTLGALVLNQRPCKLQQEMASRAILAEIRRQGFKLLNLNAKTQQLRARLQFLHCHDKRCHWPDYSDQTLLQELESWLLPFLGNSRNRSDLKNIDLHSALSSRLDWQQQRQLDKLAPERMTVPSGSRINLQYSVDSKPILAVKLQEMFGQRDTPRIANGQVAVVVHLLSPAGRPLQITQDLPHFWEQIYPEVQKEMKGRYPKHPWPDDPLKALPTAKTKRKLAQQEK